MFKVGIIGYSAQKFDKSAARQLIELGVETAMDEAISKNPQVAHKAIAVVSGYTNLGVPALAYEIFGEDCITIGVACKKAKEFDLYPVDVPVIVGNEWGDESETFLSMLDALVRVGGGKQSMAEVQRAKELGIPVYEYHLEAVA